MTLQRRSLRSAPAVLNTADKAIWVTGWNEAVDALEAEQAHKVEPHGGMINGMSEVMSRGHAQAVQTEHQAMGGTAVAYPVYLHPAPPAGERAKVGDSRFESWYSELHQAGKGSKQIAREAYEAGLNEAQQVAVPDHKPDWSAA